MLGVLDDIRKAPRSHFMNSGRSVIVLGTTYGHLGGSTYLAAIHERVAGDAPALDMKKELRLYNLLASLVDATLIESAHDCSDGGLAVALAECCILGERTRIGASVQLEGSGMRTDQLLFGEDQTRVIVSCTAGNASQVEKLAREAGIESSVIGKTGGDGLVIEGILDVPVEELGRSYFGTIAAKMKKPT
jgi:phosphoribosylformylglycinamidine synthase